MKKIGNKMWPYVKHVFDRDNIHYLYDPNTGEMNASVSSRRMKEALEDAFCEKQSQEYYDGNIPVYSLRTLKNRKKLKRLQEFYGRRSYVILKKDEQRYRQEFGL